MMLYPTLWRARRTPAICRDVLGVGQEVDRFFDSLMRVPEGQAESPVVWSPVVDVRETDDGIQVTTELPGLKPDDVQVTVDDGVLRISGEKQREIEKDGRDENGDAYHLVERRYGRFERSFTLPRAVDAEKVKAQFDDGVLKIDLPKTAQAKPKQIAIK